MAGLVVGGKGSGDGRERNACGGRISISGGLGQFTGGGSVVQAHTSGLPRLPAAELESAVLDQLRAILRAPNLLGDMLPQAIKLDPTLDEAKITVAMTRLDAIWDQLFPAEQTRIVKLLVEKVIVSPNDLEVRLRANGIERLVLELRPEPVEQQMEALA